MITVPPDAALAKTTSRSLRRRYLWLAAVVVTAFIWRGVADYRYSHVPYRTVIVPRLYPTFVPQVNGLVFSPDDQTIAAIEAAGVGFWSVPQLRLERQFKAPVGGEISSIAWQSDGRTLIFGDTGSVSRWDVSRKGLAPLPFRPHLVLPCGGKPCFLYDRHQVVVSSSGKLVAVAGVTGATAVWDTTTGHQLFAIPVPLPGKDGPSVNFCDIAISPDDKWAATTSVQENDAFAPAPLDIMVRDARTGRVLRKWQWNQANLSEEGDSSGGNLGDTGLTFSPDGALLATANNLKVTLWDTQNGMLRQTLSVPIPSDVGGYGGKKRLVFFDKGRLLVGIGWGAAIPVWNVRTGALLQTFYSESTNFLDAVAISPDEHWLAIGDDNGRIELWDVSRLLR